MHAHAHAHAHTLWMSLFCQSSEWTATSSILIIVRGRSDAHQGSLPIRLHAVYNINGRLHTSTWIKGRLGKMFLDGNSISSPWSVIWIIFVSSFVCKSILALFINVTTPKLSVLLRVSPELLALTEWILLCSLLAFKVSWNMIRPIELKCITGFTFRRRVCALVQNRLQWAGSEAASMLRGRPNQTTLIIRCPAKQFRHV